MVTYSHDVIFEGVCRFLDTCIAKGDDPEAVSWSAAHWMQDRAAGMPRIPMILDNTRQDAMMWAETAAPIELECYLLAAIRKIEQNRNSFARPHTKRMIAALFGALPPEDRAAFLQWANDKKEP